MTAVLDISRTMRPLFESETKPEQLLTTAVQNIWPCERCLDGSSDLIMQPLHGTRLD